MPFNSIVFSFMSDKCLDLDPLSEEEEDLTELEDHTSEEEDPVLGEEELTADLIGAQLIDWYGVDMARRILSVIESKSNTDSRPAEH